MQAEEPDAAAPVAAPPPEPEAEIPVLRDIVAPEDGDDDAAAPGLDRDAREALGAEAWFLLDELLDEYLPLLEAQLRARLEQRLREWLEAQR